MPRLLQLLEDKYRINQYLCLMRGCTIRYEEKGDMR